MPLSANPSETPSTEWFGLTSSEFRRLLRTSAVMVGVVWALAFSLAVEFAWLLTASQPQNLFATLENTLGPSFPQDALAASQGALGVCVALFIAVGIARSRPVSPHAEAQSRAISLLSMICCLITALPSATFAVILLWIPSELLRASSLLFIATLSASMMGLTPLNESALWTARRLSADRAHMARKLSRNLCNETAIPFDMTIRQASRRVIAARVIVVPLLLLLIAKTAIIYAAPSSLPIRWLLCTALAVALPASWFIQLKLSLKAAMSAHHSWRFIQGLFVLALILPGGSIALALFYEGEITLFAFIVLLVAFVGVSSSGLFACNLAGGKLILHVMAQHTISVEEQTTKTQDEQLYARTQFQQEFPRGPSTSPRAQTRRLRIGRPRAFRRTQKARPKNPAMKSVHGTT